MTPYRCTGAVVLWTLFFALIAAALSRYDLIPAIDAGASYLHGLAARARDSLYYQAMIVAFFGCAAYGLSLVVALGRWVREEAGREGGRLSGWAPWAAGLSNAGPENRRWADDAPVALELAASPLRDATVIFPAVGFIGTVIGVSLAIGGLQAVVETGETAPLLEGLRVAFDTTLLGLLASVLLTAILTLVQSRSTVLRAQAGGYRLGR